jgi:hypothetical protein
MEFEPLPLFHLLPFQERHVDAMKDFVRYQEEASLQLDGIALSPDLSNPLAKAIISQGNLQLQSKIKAVRGFFNNFTSGSSITIRLIKEHTEHLDTLACASTGVNLPLQDLSEILQAAIVTQDDVPLLNAPLVALQRGTYVRATFPKTT